jgi:hypothetical protein
MYNFINSDAKENSRLELEDCKGDLEGYLMDLEDDPTNPDRIENVQIARQRVANAQEDYEAACEFVLGLS